MQTIQDTYRKLFKTKAKIDRINNINRQNLLNLNENTQKSQNLTKLQKAKLYKSSSFEQNLKKTESFEIQKKNQVSEIQACQTQRMPEYESQLYLAISRYRQNQDGTSLTQCQIQENYEIVQEKLNQILLNKNIQKNVFDEIIDLIGNKSQKNLYFYIKESGQNIQNAQQFSQYCMQKIQNSISYDTVILRCKENQIWIYVAQSDTFEFIVWITLF